MFRTFALLALSFPALAALSQAGDQLYTATPEQLAVTKVVVAQENAWNRGDLDGYLAHFKESPETEVMLAGPVRGMANVRSAFHLNFPNKDAMGTLEDSEVKVRELGEGFALATGKYRILRTRKGGGNIEGTFIEVYEKTPGGWRVIFHEAT